MESQKGNYQKALEYIKEAYSTNNRDGRIVTCYASLLRHTNEKEKAKSLIDALLAYDPLHFTALYEKELLEGRTEMT
ncbi:MAG: tetratricopeptide repeat protein, partial [Bacteroidota bacterium]